MTRESGARGERVEEMARFLEDRRSSLRSSVRRLMTQRRTDQVARATDTVTRAAETLQDEVQAALMEAKTRELAQIESALERLAVEEYGVCRECGGSIGLPRLKALPFAERCAPCQARAEAETRPAPAPVPIVFARTDDGESEDVS